MFPATPKLANYGAFALMLAGASFVGLQHLRPYAPLSVAPISGKTPPTSALPSQDAKPTEIPMPTPTSPKFVVVAMAGAVKIPGLLHLTNDARVGDAIKRAGGAKSNADLDSINLAARLVDGDQVYVPYRKSAPSEKPVEVARVSRKHRGGEMSPHYAPLPPAMPPTLGGDLPAAVGDLPRHEPPKSDGTIVHEPSASDAPPSIAASPEESPRTEHGHRSAKSKATGPVSLNTASESELETLPGVGPATAQKILAYRREHGRFGSIEEIMSVKGIGAKKFEKMKPFLQL